MLLEPLRRRRAGSDAAWILAWILLLVVAGAAVVAAVYSILDYNRVADAEGAILSAISTVQTGVTSLLSSAATIISDLSSLSDALSACCTAIQSALSAISSTLATMMARECIPLYAADQILAPGCYYFAQDIVCNLTDYAICFLLENNIDIQMRGQSLELTDPTTTAFAAYNGKDLRIRHGSIFTSAPSNQSLSRAVDAYLYDDVVLEDLHIYNFFRPISHAYSTGLTVSECTVTGAYSPGAGGATNRVISLTASSGVTIGGCTFADNNVKNGDPAAQTYGVTAMAVSGWPISGLLIDGCHFTDTIVSLITSTEFDPVSGVGIVESDFTITDSSFPGQFVNIGGCASDVRCAPPTGVTMVGCEFQNRNAAPTFDAIFVERVDTLLIEACTVTSNSIGFDPAKGVLQTGLIHVCNGNSAINTASPTTGSCRGVVLRGNSLLGGPFNTTNPDFYNRASSFGVIFESGTIGALMEDNKLYGFAGGMAGGNVSGNPYPAQVPAAISVQAGTVDVHLKENSITVGGCGEAPQTIGAPGIDVRGAEFRSSFAPGGLGPVFFQAAQATSVEGNHAAFAGCSQAYVDAGFGTVMWANEAHENYYGGYSVPATTIVQCRGCLHRAGSNLDDCVAPAGNWTC